MLDQDEKSRYDIHELQMEINALIELKYKQSKEQKELKELVNESKFSRSDISVSPISH